jgi:glycolate oxidase iron-sulfur subunit
LLFDRLLPHPRRLHLAARAVALGKNSGMSDLARALGLLRIFGRNLSRAEEIVDKLPAQAFRVRFKPGVYDGQGRGRQVAYFVGCGIDVVRHTAGEATLALLRRSSRSVRILDNNCCGLPAWSYGDLAAARKLGGRNLPVLTAPGVDTIVTDCSSCTGFIKKYPRLFPEDEPNHQAAQSVAARTRDVSEWLAEQIIPFSNALQGRRVTFHDPCHASRGQGLVKQPRELLRKMPGAEFVELPEADWCCGGAGSYALSHYDLAMRVLDRKMENLKRTAADVLVTTCPACMIQLSYGVRRHGLKVDVRHLTEVL